jgi:hypothetical protein
MRERTHPRAGRGGQTVFLSTLRSRVGGSTAHRFGPATSPQSAPPPSSSSRAENSAEFLEFLQIQTSTALAQIRRCAGRLKTAPSAPIGRGARFPPSRRPARVAAAAPRPTIARSPRRAPPWPRSLTTRKFDPDNGPLLTDNWQPAIAPNRFPSLHSTSPGTNRVPNRNRKVPKSTASPAPQPAPAPQ